jgi:AraC-like DNA-binding protein
MAHIDSFSTIGLDHRRQLSTGTTTQLTAVRKASWPSQCRRRAACIRIINYTEAHLHDPDLTPTRVAEAGKITPRYLHHLFSDREETVARYIVRRRLDECARALVCSAQRSRTGGIRVP